MVYVTLAAVDARGGFAQLETLRIPFDWHGLVPDEGRLSVVYRPDNLEVISRIIEADGSRSDGLSSGPIRDASMPCADPAAATTILRELASGLRPAPLEMPG